MLDKWCLGYLSVGPNWKKQEQIHKEFVEERKGNSQHTHKHTLSTAYANSS